jgi:membrane protein DedA with SNARE-associated domain
MFEWIEGVIARLGYVGVAVLTLLENVFPPIPSELVIPLAGFVAAQGELRFSGVIAAASAGSLAGAALWYGLARRIGERRFRAWIERYGKWLTISVDDLDRAQDWFRRHGRTAVLVGRLIPGVRTLISLPAGFLRMPVLPFLLFSAVGTVAWTTALAAAGLVLEANFALVAGYIDLVADALLVLLGAFLARRYVRCWNSNARSGVRQA